MEAYFDEWSRELPCPLFASLLILESNHGLIFLIADQQNSEDRCRFRLFVLFFDNFLEPQLPAELSDEPCPILWTLVLLNCNGEVRQYNKRWMIMNVLSFHKTFQNRRGLFQKSYLFAAGHSEE